MVQAVRSRSLTAEV